MIYSKGTVGTTRFSPIVTGDGTKWLKYVHAGDLFELSGAYARYQIAEVIGDTELRLVQGAPIGRDAIAYTISSDFTHYSSLPYPRGQDIEKATILKRATNKVDSLLSGMGDRVFAIEYPVGSVVDIVSVPAIDTIYITPPIDMQVDDMASTPAFPSVQILPQGVLGPADSTSTPFISTVSLPDAIITADSTLTADTAKVTADGLYTPSLPDAVITADSTLTADAANSSADGLYTP